MKISCLPVGMYSQFLSGRVKILDWVIAGEKMGLDGVDISSQFFSRHVPVWLEDETRTIREQGIPIVMVADYTDFTNPDKVQLERELMYIGRDIALASQYGASYVRVLAGQQYDDLRKEDGIESAAKYLQKASEIARDFGITLVYENDVAPSAWQKKDFSMLPNVFVDLVDKFRGTQIKVNFDTANALACDEDAMELFLSVVDMVETLHVSDTSTRGYLTPVPIGTGLVPLREIFSVLKQRKFEGYLCVEAGVETTFEQINETIKRVHSIWTDA